MQAKTITFIDRTYHGDAMNPGRPSKTERSAFGKRLQTLRENAKLTQREVAAALGVSQPSYAAWERYTVALSADQIQKLANTFGVEASDLFHDEFGSRKRNGPVGRARKTFETISDLPRSRQKQILDVVDILLAKAV